MTKRKPTTTESKKSFAKWLEKNVIADIDIDPDAVGITMTHEHPLINMTSWFRMPTEESKKWIAKSKVKIDMLGDLRRDPSTCIDNMILDDIDIMSNEISLYKDAGGSTLVACSVEGLGRDPVGLKEVSIKTGVNIIVPTGLPGTVEAVKRPGGRILVVGFSASM